jgi:hypothetical protein
MKDAIGYIRVSSEEQADSGLGLAAQRQLTLGGPGFGEEVGPDWTRNSNGP